MLIGNVYITEAGMRLVDVDGSQVDIKAYDALALRDWLDVYREQLLKIVRREQNKQANVTRKERNENIC